MTVAITQPYTITVTVTPSVSAINLSNTSVNAGQHNANTVVGRVTVTSNPPGQDTTATITLSGTEASRFVLSSGGVTPCDLKVGPQDIPAGSYAISLVTEA